MQISIIITTYNYEKYLQECIESCLEQKGFYDYEIIVINDGSIDGSLEILKKYNKVEKIKIFNNSNHGIEYSSNFGIKEARGEYIVRVDADDLLDENFLFELVPILENDNISFVYSNYSVVNENGSLIKEVGLPSFDKEEILSRGDFLATGTIYKKNVLENIGLYNENKVNSGLENYELMIKLLINGYIGKHINKLLFKYRRHNKNISELKKREIVNYGQILFDKFNLGEFRTNKYHPYGLVIND